MKCPHCSVTIRFEESYSSTYKYDDDTEGKVDGATGYKLAHGFCPECDGLIVVLSDGIVALSEDGEYLAAVENVDIIYPKSASRPVESEVPAPYCDDYREAAAVLGLSPKASAAISRRLLQQIVREELGIRKRSLAKEIAAVIDECGLPSYLNDAIDAVRIVGNFAAHPLKDTNTGEIVDVEPGEAEWLLEVLDSLFDFVFVQPERLKAKKTKLNAKLERLGKSPMKDT